MVIEALSAWPRSITLFIWLAKNGRANCKNAAKVFPISCLSIFKEEIKDAYAIADVVITGLIATLTELAALGKPAICCQCRTHIKVNAKLLVDQQAAVVMDEEWPTD